jgi:hypothetical protein
VVSASTTPLRRAPTPGRDDHRSNEIEDEIEHRVLDAVLGQDRRAQNCAEPADGELDDLPEDAEGEHEQQDEHEGESGRKVDVSAVNVYRPSARIAHCGDDRRRERVG